MGDEELRTLGKVAFWLVGLPLAAALSAWAKSAWREWRHPTPPPRTTWMLTGEPYED